MTGSVIELPFGVIQLFKLGCSSTILVNDNIEHRPDKVLKLLGVPYFVNEMANNRASNISPISMNKRKRYTILNNLFLSYFRRSEDGK